MGSALDYAGTIARLQAQQGDGGFLDSGDPSAIDQSGVISFLKQQAMIQDQLSAAASQRALQNSNPRLALAQKAGASITGAFAPPVSAVTAPKAGAEDPAVSKFKSDVQDDFKQTYIANMSKYAGNQGRALAETAQSVAAKWSPLAPSDKAGAALIAMSERATSHAKKDLGYNPPDGDKPADPITFSDGKNIATVDKNAPDAREQVRQLIQNKFNPVQLPAMGTTHDVYGQNSTSQVVWDGTKFVPGDGAKPYRQETVTGSPDDFTGNSTSRQAQRDFDTVKSTSRVYIAGLNDILAEIKKGAPTGWAGKSLAKVNDAYAGVKTLVNTLDVQPSADQAITNSKAFQSLTSKGVRADVVRGLMLSAAYQGAAMNGQSGRSVSDKDVVNMLAQIGGDSADPNVIQSLASYSALNAKRRVKATWMNRPKLYGELPSEFDVDMGDLGTPAQPTIGGPSPGSTLSPDQAERLRKLSGG